MLHLALVLHGASRHSAVFDEVVYPTSGYSYLTTGDYRMNPEHPPFLKLWTGLAWLGSGLNTRATAGWIEGDQWKFGQAMIYSGAHDPGVLLLRARAMIALLSAILALSIVATGRAIGGDAAGLAALALYALDPLVIAHAGFATTDLGGAAFYFLASVAIVWATTRGGAARTIVAGILVGLALASKFSALPILGVLLALGLSSAVLVRRHVAAERNTQGGSAISGTASAVLGRSAVIAGIGLLVAIACYGPAGPGDYFRGLSLLEYHNRVGHPAYAFGQYGTHGWWWYFPAAWAVKTPLVILLASVAGVVLLSLRLLRGALIVPVVLLAPALVVIPAMASPLNLGVRHLLPVTPFLAVAGGVALGKLVGKGAFARLSLFALFVWLLAGTLAVHPDEMAYANEASGGSANLWRLLSDSSVDWGQDLPALAKEVKKKPLRRLYLGYFGTADPKAYGLPYQWIPSMRMIDQRYEDGPDRAGREWIALSVTNLLEVYSTSHDAYEWLRKRPFTAFPGRSIALFDITGDAEAHRRLGEVAMRFGDAVTAEGPLRRAIEIAPRDGAARLDLAQVLAERSKRAEAVAECAEAERLLPASRTREICTAIRASAGSR